jgi:hypothetical protein
MDPPGVRHQCLMLADSESEKTKWVVALNELHRILKKNKLPGQGLTLDSFLPWIHLYLGFIFTLFLAKLNLTFSRLK